MANDRLELIWGVAFGAGALAQLLARWSGLPSVVLLLALGLLVGQGGLGWVDPQALGHGLEPLVGLLVSMVLFDGGLGLQLSGPSSLRTLTTLRLVWARWPLGLLGGAVAAHGLAGLSWPLAWVFGAIALATGPTVVTSLVRQIRLDADLAGVLEAEGLILEPVGAVLALLLLQVALGDLQGWRHLVGLLLARLLGGVLIGGLTGLLLALLLERLTPLAEPDRAEPQTSAPQSSAPQSSAVPSSDPQSSAVESSAADSAAPHTTVSNSSAVPASASQASAALPEADNGLGLQLTLGVLFLMFSVCEALLPQSGLPAAVSAGLVLGLRRGPAVRSLDTPIRQLAMLAITVLFPLLAADLGWSDLEQLGWGGLACVLALLALRWLVVQVAGLGLTALDWRRKLILSWIAPRGIVTAAVASLFALQLDEAGQPGGAVLKGLVFLTILFTVSVQGLTAPWLARWLGLVEAPPAPLATGIPQGTAEL
ncbi:MAG: cation:proton antiporter [Synechococcaceae cyanobacterium]|jgi:NhaP-type Na+/H+ or K+/H+ antiporter